MAECVDNGWSGLTGEDGQIARRNFERYLTITSQIAARVSGLHEGQIDSCVERDTMTERSNKQSSN